MACHLQSFSHPLSTLNIHLNNPDSRQPVYVFPQVKMFLFFSIRNDLCIPPVLQKAQGIHSFDNTGFKIQNCGIAQEEFQKDSVTWWSLFCTQQIGFTMKHLVQSIFKFLSFPFFYMFTLGNLCICCQAEHVICNLALPQYSHLSVYFDTVTLQS